MAVTALKRLLVPLAAALLAGCQSVGMVGPGDAFNPDRDTIYVLGVAPDNYKITVYPGEVRDGTFVQNAWSIYRVFSTPVDGYLVWKGSPEEIFAITGVRALRDKTDLIGPDYGPCGNARTMTFRAGAGKVVYFGDLRYLLRNNRMSIELLDRPERAREYLDGKFPALRGRMESAKPEMMPGRLLVNCSGSPGYVPSFIFAPPPR